VPYLLDAGVDGFQGMQEAIETKIDIAKLADMTTRSGKKPVIVGSVSSVSTMPFGNPDDVRADVRRCQELARKRGGGWLLNFSSSLGPEVPEENIKAYFEAARK
jgi:uroporphyrinogen decarboxylase